MAEHDCFSVLPALFLSFGHKIKPRNVARTIRVVPSRGFPLFPFFWIRLKVQKKFVLPNWWNFFFFLEFWKGEIQNGSGFWTRIRPNFQENCNPNPSLYKVSFYSIKGVIFGVEGREEGDTKTKEKYFSQSGLVRRNSFLQVSK